MELVYIAVVLVVVGVVLFFIHKTYNSQVRELKKEIEKVCKERDKLQQAQIGYVSEIANLKANLTSKEELIQSKQEELVIIREQLNKEFRVLANEIMEEKAARFTETNKINIEAILKPLNERLVEFKDKVEQTYDKESKQRFSLEERIRELVALNNQISEDANNLTRALKGNTKIQGNWGEMLLESILEKSGLRKGIEYIPQSSIKNNEGDRLQPDITVIYPGGRKIIIDSKVSLSAYVRYVEADTEDNRKLAEKEHLISVRKHVDELSSKCYQDHVESLDFVMMFIANEPAYILAMQLDSTIWDYAYKKRVLLINHTNLVAALKVVADLWKREYQNQNAIEIAKRGALLYEKFANFIETLQEVGRNFERSQRSYNKAISQLKDGNGNLIRQAEMLKELGVKAQKEIPELSDIN